MLGKYTLKETKEITLSGRSIPTHRILSDMAVQEGLSCAQKEVVILNLLSNGGGSSDYPEHFYKGLRGIEENGFSGAHLPMPEDVKDGVKAYDRYDCVKESDIKNTFQGKLFVLMNKGTGSSAEMAVSPVFYVKNAIFAGSATGGCCNFGECLFYQLPDYWIDDVNPVEVIERYIRTIKK